MTEKHLSISLKCSNIFVLNSGRSGSNTFIEACKHISNFSCEHESRSCLLGEARFDYPENHIEADNRLSWFLGKLDRHYGNQAAYVHLIRDRHDTARSYVKRYPFSIVKAYRQAILMGATNRSDPMSICLDYCDTINTNIELFLKDKIHKMTFRLENAKQDFQDFWKLIGAEGDIDGAIAEFDICYNASDPSITLKEGWFPKFAEIRRKLTRLVVNMPNYIKNG